MKTDYHDRAASWAVDSQVQAARSRRFAWTVAGVAAAAVLFEAVALALLVPLKTVQPVTLLVDRQTGYVQALDPLRPQRIAADDALTQSYLAQYVMAREGFDRATVKLDYRKVALWSAGNARSRYLASMPATNPNSPLARYPGGTIVSARVKSVSRLGANLALVRFDTQRVDRNGQVDTPSPWIAVIRYRFVDAPMSLADRLINPLGFQATGYRRDAEAVAPTESKPVPVVVSSRSPIVVPAAAPAEPARVYPAAPARRDVLPASRPRTSGVETGMLRAVPINQLPMGSPLSPQGAAPVVVATQP